MHRVRYVEMQTPSKQDKQGRTVLESWLTPPLSYRTYGHQTGEHNVERCLR